MDIIECIAGHDYIRTKSNCGCLYCALAAAEAENKRLERALEMACESVAGELPKNSAFRTAEWKEYFIKQALAEKP